MVAAYLAVEAAGGAVRQYLPVWEVPPDAWLKAAVLALAMGLLAGAVPAWNAMRLPIVEALRGPEPCAPSTSCIRSPRSP